MWLSNGTLIALVLTIGVVKGNYFDLSELIEKVHSKSDSATICFVEIDSEFLDVFVKTHPSIPMIIFKFSSLNITWKNDTQLYGNVIIVIEAVINDLNYIELLHQLILQLGVRNFAIIRAGNFYSLQEYFSYFWKNKFRRTFGIANRTSFAHMQFADIPFLKIVKSEPTPKALQELNGFKIRTVIRPDVPRVFWHTDKNGVRKIGGFVGRLFVNFLEKHNATFEEILADSLDKGRETRSVLKGTIDVSMLPYIPTEGIQMSYPVKLSRWTIMMPLKGYLDPNQYFMRPFSLTVWTCIGITFAYIVLMKILMNKISGLPADAWHSFSQLYLTMLNMSLDQTYQRAYRFQVVQKLFAFIIVNFYIVFLTSFLTIFIKVKEYETVQDLIDARVPVMMAFYDWNYTDHKIFPKGFENIVALVPSEVLIKERTSMRNTSFAYGIGLDSATFLLSLTEKYAKPKFKVISGSLNQALFAFQWAKHAPFHEILSDFIFRILDTGLMIKWTRDATVQGAEVVIENMRLRAESYEFLFPLTMRHLDFAWNSLASGLTAASLVFLAEKCIVFVWKSWEFWNKFKK